MSNFLQNLDPQMFARMRTADKENDSNVPLDSTDTKANQAGQDTLNTQTDPSRCWTCKRKVGLLGFKCRCHYTFCSKHRLASDHECTYDYLTANKELLTKQLTPCVADKVHDRI